MARLALAGEALHRVKREHDSWHARRSFNCALFAARANRYNVQPLRLALTSPRKGYGFVLEEHP